MFRIAVCDDSEPILSQLNAVLYDYSGPETIELEAFATGETLWHAISSGEYFDLIFLDIEMNLLSGIEVGRKLRNSLKNETTQIVYILTHQKYAMALFENRPLNFLIKPLDHEQVIKALKKALELAAKGNLTFEFSVGKDFYRLPFRDILYFQSENKK